MLSFRSTTVSFVCAGMLVRGPAPTKAQPDCNNNGIDDACELGCALHDLPRHTCGTCKGNPETVQWRKQVEKETHDDHQRTL
jgi:hypothetical protein